MVSAPTHLQRPTKARSRAQARRMRHTPVAAEKIFWSEVRNRNLAGYKFKRQHPIATYIADFVCLEAKLIVELDGPFHALKRKHDKRRDEALRQHGFTTLRIRNEDLAADLLGTLQLVKHYLVNAPLPLSTGC